MIIGFGVGMFRLILNIVYGLVGKVGGMIKPALYLNSDKARTEYFEDLTKVSDKISSSFPPDMAASLNGKLSEAKDAILTLTVEGKTYASGLIEQVKETIHAYYLETGGLVYKIASINWLHFTVLLFFLSILSMVVISLLTKAPSKEQMNYTYSAATPEDRAKSRASWSTWDVINTVIIISVVVLFYIIFW